MSQQIVNTMTETDRQIEFDIEFPSTELEGSADASLSGKVRVRSTHGARVGGATRGSLNLGFRLLVASSRKVIYEDRAVISSAELSPGVWYDFVMHLRTPDSLNELMAIQIDFVREEEYWFEEFGNRGFQKEIQLKRTVPEAVVPVVLDAFRRLPKTIRRNLVKTEESRSVNSGRYIFDISDLMQFWADNINPTGIQRVQIEVLKSIIEKSIDSAFAGIEVCAIYFDSTHHDWSLIDTDLLLHQIKLSYRHGLSMQSWLKDLANVLSTGRAYVPTIADTIINLGSSWWIPDYLHKMRCLRIEHGVRYIPFVHDTIPLVTPQFCAEGLVQEFKLWFRGAMSVADHIIVNSLSSRNDVQSAALSLTGECADISVARLNAAFPRPNNQVRSGIVQRHNLDMSRYVLCVGTLEARKNHALILQVWSALAAKISRDKMAILVLVGKQGWMFDVARSLLARDPNLKKVVLVLDNLSDQELSDLYRGCLFTVYPSFYEGWGLPITEAVSYGKLTVASNTSSVPEAASEGDILLDPTDANAWEATIRNLLEDSQFLDLSTEVSHQRANIRSWPDVANDILTAARDSPRRVNNDRVKDIVDGRIYDFSLSTARENFDCSAQPFRSGVGWHHLEDWGAWSAPGITELRFKTSSTDARFFYLVVRGASEQLDVSVVVDREPRISRVILAEERLILRADLHETTKDEHTIRIAVHDPIDLAPKTNNADRRRIGIGFLNMCCSTRQDVQSRLNFFEAMNMQFI